jgi:hypothetical protein
LPGPKITSFKTLAARVNRRLSTGEFEPRREDFGVVSLLRFSLAPREDTAQIRGTSESLRGSVSVLVNYYILAAYEGSWQSDARIELIENSAADVPFSDRQGLFATLALLDSKMSH